MKFESGPALLFGLLLAVNLIVALVALVKLLST